MEGIKHKMKVHFISLGCKTNQYESNAMEQSFIKKSYEIVDEKEKADIYVINTCSVTNIAERKSRQFLRRAKAINPDAIVIASGCYVQVAKEEISKIKEVDLVLGINEKNKIVEIVEDYLKNSHISKNQDINKKDKDEKIDKNKNTNINTNAIVTDVMHKDEYEEFGIITYTEVTRAVIKIQDGCDRFCTYCIIPYARGKVRSRQPENIISEIKEIAKKGIQEVVLTGIHIASYGKDFSEDDTKKYRKLYGYNDTYEKFDPKEDLKTGGFRLIELLEQINKIDEIKRIRLGSIEPKLITEEFVNRLSKLKKICHHFHLSLQSGCNETLKRMNRRYTVEEFENICKILRKAYQDVILTTDIIVGFPNETNEEFERTYNFLKRIKFYKMHIFKYSPKRGTVAEKMDNQIDGNIKEMRSQKLIELSNENQKEYNQSYIGKVVSVLFEEKDSDGYYKGHTDNYLLVKIKSEKCLENIICNVKIIKSDGLELIGEINNN